MVKELQALLDAAGGNVVLASALATLRLTEAILASQAKAPRIETHPITEDEMEQRARDFIAERERERKRYEEDIAGIEKATGSRSARPDLELAFLQATDAPHLPADFRERVRAADARDDKERVQADLDALGTPYNGTAPPLPSFDELQEGDWVELETDAEEIHARASGTVCESLVSGYIKLREDDGGAHSCRISSWRVVAFKPLRQVVDELAATARCNIHLRGELLDNGRRYLNVKAPDERTALLAAKAALEVMIARKGKP